MRLYLVSWAVVALIAALWAIGFLTTNRIISPIIGEMTLGACWLQLSMPMVFSVYGLLANNRFCIALAGAIILYFASSNYISPNNGFVNAGTGSWYFQVPVLGMLGAVLFITSFSTTTAKRFGRIAFVNRLREPPIVVKLILIVLLLHMLLLSVMIWKRNTMDPNLTVNLLGLAASGLALSFVIASLSKRHEYRKLLYAACSILLVGVFVSCSAGVGLLIETAYRLEIASMFCCSFLLLSPSVRTWVSGQAACSKSSQISIAELFYFMTVFGAAAAGFVLLDS